MAPAGAAALLKVYGRSDGMYEITYAMPDGSRQMVLEYEERNMAAGPTLVQQLWDELDLQYNFYQEKKQIVGQDPKQLDFAKGYLRGIAKALAIFMQPHFTTSDEIAKEAHKRWTARQNGEEYETPGIGSRRYEFTADKYTVGDIPTTRQRNKTQRSSARQQQQDTIDISKIDDKTKAGIKMAMKSGMFTAAQLAKSYSISAAAIEKIAAEGD